MLRKNKCFLDGVNMVESQIIYTEPHTEDIRHRRRIPEQPHLQIPVRKTYNFDHHHQPTTIGSPRTNLPIQGRRSLMESDEYIGLTQRSSDLNRTLKGKTNTYGLKAESRLGDDKTMFQTLRPAQMEFLNDYQRKGSRNCYNIFQQEEALRQKLPKCDTCSTNIDNVIKTYVCVSENCKKAYDFVCPNCHSFGKDYHNKHCIVPIMSVCYFFQKQTNDPANLHRKGQIRIIIQQINQALLELQQEITKLIELKERLETALTNSQIKSDFSRISQDLQKMLHNMEDMSDYDLQCTLRKTLQNANVNKIKESQSMTPNLTSKFFPRINELFETLPQPYFPLKQHLAKPLLIEPMSIFTSSFIGEQLEIVTSAPVSLRQLGRVKLICDGQMRLSIEKVHEANVIFKGRRMDRQIRNVIEALVKWSSKKNRFKAFEYSFDYKLNAHPTTEHSPMLSELMRINSNCIRVSLINIRNNDMSRKQFNQVFASFRQVKELSLIITLNHLHSQSPIFLQRPENLLHFIKSLGNKLIRLNLQIPVSIPQSVAIEILRQLLNRPYLCQVNLKFDEDFEGKSEFLYQQLQKFCKRRAITVMKLKLLTQKTELLKKFGDKHFEVVDILL